MGRWERNSEPGGADETRYRTNLLIPSLRCRLQMRLRIRIGTMGSWVTSKINSPEVRRGMEKFKGDEIVAVFVTDEASDAANGVLIGLKVGDHDLLESDDVGCEADQSARPTDVRSDGRFGKRCVRRMAVDEHGHGCCDAVSAAFFGGARPGGIAGFASEHAPTGKDELAHAHDIRLAREGGFAAMGKTFFWERAVYTGI